MISFRRRSLLDRIKYRLWKPYREKVDRQNKKTIRWLLDHPEAPCSIDGFVVPDSYGKRVGLVESLIGTTHEKL